MDIVIGCQAVYYQLNTRPLTSTAAPMATITVIKYGCMYQEYYYNGLIPGVPHISN